MKKPRVLFVGILMIIFALFIYNQLLERTGSSSHIIISSVLNDKSENIVDSTINNTIINDTQPNGSYNVFSKELDNENKKSPKETTSPALVITPALSPTANHQRKCPTCSSIEHPTHPRETKPIPTPNPTKEPVSTPVSTPRPTEAPKCGSVGHSEDGKCPVCDSTYTTPVATPEPAWTPLPVSTPVP